MDFAAYRKPTLERRILSRMITLGIARLADYLRHLERSELEAALLLERILIKVSRFYRHPPTFDLLRERVIPRLAALRRPVGAWSAGCGRGEEAYTIAMLLDEAGIEGGVQATDIDARALECGREGLYPEEAAVELPSALAERYLEPLVARRPALGIRPGVLPQAQAEVLANLCAALSPQGYLCLGEAEWPVVPTTTQLKPVVPNARVFSASALAGALT